MPGPPAEGDVDVPASAGYAAGESKASTRLRGFVRTYCPFKQRGTVQVKGGKHFGDREFYIEPEEATQCDDLSVGAAISFCLKANRRGAPRVCDINTLIKGVPQREFVTKLAAREDKVDWDKTYTGRIVWYLKENTDALPASLARKDPGYGWISCDETKKMFGYDVWAYPSKLAGCKVGDWVTFKVSIDYYWSWPVARDIHPTVPPKGAPSKAQALANSMDDLLTANPRAAGTLAQTLDDVINQMEAARAAGDATIEIPELREKSALESIPTEKEPSEEAEAQQPQNETILANEDDAAQVNTDQQASEADWQRYALEDGQGFWWYRESNQDFFMESDPGLWTKFSDPNSGRYYWWKDGESCLWV